jgi:hypothetical protein
MSFTKWQDKTVQRQQTFNFNDEKNIPVGGSSRLVASKNAMISIYIFQGTHTIKPVSKVKEMCQNLAVRSTLEFSIAFR